MAEVVNNAAFAFVAASVVALILPDRVVEEIDLLYQFRVWLRRSFRYVTDITVQGPFFQLLLRCLRCRGANRRSSTGDTLTIDYDAPHSLRVEPLGGTELMLWWTARPLHEDRFICAWRQEVKGVFGGAWHEVTITENSCKSKGWRWNTLLSLDSLSTTKDADIVSDARARVRIRVSAICHGGRRAWSEEKEVELELVPANANAGVTYATAAPEYNRYWLCLQCQAPQPKRCSVWYADVVCRGLFAQGCLHGPFCARCCRAVGAQVLPSCICRALVATWREEQASDSILEKDCDANEEALQAPGRIWDDRETMVWVKVTMKMTRACQTEEEMHLCLLQRWKAARQHLTPEQRHAIREVLEAQCGISL